MDFTRLKLGKMVYYYANITTPIFKGFNPYRDKSQVIEKVAKGAGLIF